MDESREKRGRILTSEQIRAARALLRLDQKALARASGVSVPTIKRLEAATGPAQANVPTLICLRRAIEAAGAILIEDGEDGPGVRLTRDRADALIAQGATPD